MEPQVNSQPVKKKIKLDFKDSKYATGRRKKSIAKVWLKKGSGNIFVNGIKMNDYFKKANLQIAIFCASPLGKAVKRTLIFLQFTLSILVILGNFLLIIFLSKKLIDLPIDLVAHKYKILAFGCLDNILTSSKPMYPVAPAIAIFNESFIFTIISVINIKRYSN